MIVHSYKLKAGINFLSCENKIIVQNEYNFTQQQLYIDAERDFKLWCNSSLVTLNSKQILT